MDQLLKELEEVAQRKAAIEYMIYVMEKYELE